MSRQQQYNLILLCNAKTYVHCYVIFFFCYVVNRENNLQYFWFFSNQRPLGVLSVATSMSLRWRRPFRNKWPWCSGWLQAHQQPLCDDDCGNNNNNENVWIQLLILLIIMLNAIMLTFLFTPHCITHLASICVFNSVICVSTVFFNSEIPKFWVINGDDFISCDIA